MKRHYIIFIFIFFLTNIPIFGQNPPNRQIVLQGFWWDFRNDNFQNNWANYLVELAPRLKDLGIDAVWIPPNLKPASLGTGYNPFDHYDLGDKYQKNYSFTRMGRKDELLRMVAVLKANGIDVIQDVVLNHVTGAGSRTGAGGQDPEAIEDGETARFKNFRYVCFTSPAFDPTAEDYLSRTGRFPKNWHNFYPNNDNICCTNDLNSPWWGPDVSYESNAYGQSSNAIYNPEQGPDYMRNQMREWMIWYKKQVGFDGVRMDAVKHFPASVSEDLLWNLQFNTDFSSQGDDFFAVGEWVGGGADLDNWVDAVQNRAGTFDFGLRGELYNMVYGQGGYDLGNLPAAQQQNRLRTVPFVNNHDTFRPQLDAEGIYTGWNSEDELGSHIEPNEARMPLAYAMILAIDGAPQIFFEDLFDIGYEGNRFTHQPTNLSDLPVRDDLLNLLWCHQNLRFKEGAYQVRWQAADLLIIEREAKAVICLNDGWENWQDPIGVQTSFPDGTILKDYTGAAGTAERIVYGGGKVDLAVPPCNGAAARRGYSIWAPVGIEANYERTPKFTEQEWEMSNDLGDGHFLSLQQGGGLPANDTECRQVGKIFSNDSDEIQVQLFPTDSSQNITLVLLDETCTPLDSISGTGYLNFLYTPQTAGWKSIIIRNTTDANAGQEGIKVRAKYMAPQIVDTSVPKEKCSCLLDNPIYNGIGNITTNANIGIYPNPSKGIFHFEWPSNVQNADLKIFDLNGQLFEERQNFGGASINLKHLPKGVYFLRLEGEDLFVNEKVVVF